MQFFRTKLPDVLIVSPDKIADSRGFFARTFCATEFAKQNLCDRFLQSSISFNARKGTIRGLHMQLPPHDETKLVRCTKGSILDIVVDVRKDSQTFGEWLGVPLNHADSMALYVPSGFMHGFQTLEDDCELLYEISVNYEPASVVGVRFDDPVLAIQWPLPASNISSRDLSLPSFKEFCELF